MREGKKGEEDKEAVLEGWEEDRLDRGRVPRERRGRSRPRENGVGVWAKEYCGWSFLMDEGERGCFRSVCVSLRSVCVSLR